MFDELRRLGIEGQASPHRAHSSHGSGTTGLGLAMPTVEPGGDESPYLHSGTVKSWIPGS